MEPQDYPIAHFERMSCRALAVKAPPAPILEHRYFGESFGSWYVVIRQGGRVSQLTYDGHDDCLRLRRSSYRKPPCSYGPGQSVGAGTAPGGLGAAAIDEVCRAVTS